MPVGQYFRPPITEAVIELRFGSAISQTAMEKFLRSVAKEYPTTEQTYEVSLQVRVAEAGRDPDIKPLQNFSGYKITGREAMDAILLGPGRMATVRLAPYCGWDAFLEKVKSNYRQLRRAAGYRNLIRVATRYVNRIDIPRGTGMTVRTEDFLIIEPRTPKIIPFINQFTTHFVGVVPEVEGQVIVNASTIPSPLIDHVSLVLDIDLFKEQKLPQKDDDIWKLLAALRAQKNVLFEAFITDRARELFDRA